MKIKIKVVKENPDGSAEIEMNMDAEGMQFVYERGINFILERALSRYRIDSLVSEWENSLNGVSKVLGALPKKGRKANSEKKLGKAVGRKQTKSTTSNRRASKILGKKRN